MPTLCPNEEARRAVAPDALDRLRAHRFEEIHRRSGALTDDGVFIVEPLTPEGLAEWCVVS